MPTTFLLMTRTVLHHLFRDVLRLSDNEERREHTNRFYDKTHSIHPLSLIASSSTASQFVLTLLASNERSHCRTNFKVKMVISADSISIRDNRITQ